LCQRTEDRRLRYKYLEQSPQGACQGAPRSQQHRTASERGLGLQGSDTAVIGLSFESTTSVAPANPMPSMGASRLRCRSPCVTQAWRQWTDNSCGFSGCCNGIAKPCGTLLCSTLATAVRPTGFRSIRRQQNQTVTTRPCMRDLRRVQLVSPYKANVGGSIPSAPSKFKDLYHFWASRPFLSSASEVENNRTVEIDGSRNLVTDVELKLACIRGGGRGHQFIQQWTKAPSGKALAKFRCRDLIDVPECRGDLFDLLGGDLVVVKMRFPLADRAPDLRDALGRTFC
jgi:hypothetical protein